MAGERGEEENAVTRALIAAVLILAAPLAGMTPAAAATGPGCGDAGDLGFVCGLASVEDLVPLPGGRYLVGSSMKVGSAGLYLIDTRRKTGSAVALTVAPDQDSRFAGCAAPDLTRLSTHGLAIAKERGGGTLVYAVNHGGREAVEVFRIDPRANAAAWVGCLVLPKGASGNAVVSLPDGRIAVSRFEDAGDPQGIEKIVRGEVTGLVYIWTPGRGFAVLPGSRSSGPNGLEVSPDGRWLFLAAYGTRQIWRMPLALGGTTLKIDLPFYPDNLRWAPDGTLLVAGQYIVDGDLAGLHDWAIMRVDPQNLAVTPLLHEKASATFDSATVAVQVGRTAWIGSFRGDRIAYRALPAR